MEPKKVKQKIVKPKVIKSNSTKPKITNKKATKTKKVESIGFLKKNEKKIKNFLNIILFFVVLWLLFIWYKFLEIKFELDRDTERQQIEDLIELKNNEIISLKKDLFDTKIELFLNKINLLNDDSLTKFVSNKVPFFNLSYVPEDLVSVSWEHIVDSKGWTITVKKVLKESLDKLSEQFYEDTNNNIVIVSWYRSYLYQKWIKDRWCPDNLCAKAWYSEHQSGLAIDIYSASSERNWANDNNLRKYLSWFQANAHKYWFHQTYQNWVEIDWYEVEPWHWRYLWVDFATYLHENDLTFGQFYEKMSNK